MFSTFIKYILFPTILIFFFNCQLFAQSNGNSNDAQLSGKLLNQSQHEVVYASVALLQKDSTIVKSVISTANGDFIIEGIPSGTYKVRVDHIEYAPYTSEAFTIAPNQSKVLPNIILKPSNNALDEVVVTHKKALIEIKADKLIFNVASSPSASGTNGLDLLKKSPGVTLDIDNNIMLMGKTNVQVYLNGVPSRLTGNDLSTFLQSLTSDTIDSIEIISNPSSKYDAEGTGGIINIKLKKNVATGFNGSATSSFTKGIEYKYSNNVSLNYGSETFKVNLDITQSRDNNLVFFADNKRQNSSILDLNSKENAIRNGYNIGVGLEKQLGKNHSLNLAMRGLFNKNDNALYSTTSIFRREPEELTSILESQSFLDGSSRNYIANINHIWTTSKTSSINANFSIGSYDTQRDTQQPNTYFEQDGSTIINTENTAFNADTKINLWSAKMDFDKEWKTITFSTGLKYAQINTENAFKFFNIPNDEPIVDPTKSNDFDYEENVAAAYANINIKLSPKINLNAGLRVENTASRGRLISDIDIDNKDVSRNYTDFFPNVGLSYDDQNNHSLSISIGKRITRPNYQDLNPFETPISQLTVWKGNPFLKPNYIMNYQVSYAFKQKLIVTTSYSKTTDFFAKIVEIVGEEKNQIIPRNLQKATDLAIAVSYPIKINNIWDVMIFGNASRKTFKGNTEGTVIDLKSTLWDYRIQNNLNLPHGIVMDITFRQQSHWIWRGSVFIKGTKGLNFGIRKDFFDKKLQVKITGNDIFRTESDYPYYSDYGGIDLNGVYTADNRRYGIGITYNFGNQKAKNKMKSNNALEDELNRIEN